MEKYIIKDRISTGSTATVKECFDLDGNQFVMKIISAYHKNEKNIKKEIHIHEHIQHKNIVKLIDSFKYKYNYHLVLEFVPSELFLFLESGKGFSQKLVHFFFVQFLNALKYLHDKSICHRDIKMENILLSDDGNLLLTDFGSATIFKYKKNYRKLNTLAGSIPYMAPEVYKRCYYGDMADLWSAGILLFIMSTGCLPWKTGNSDDQDFKDFFSVDYHFYDPFSRCPAEILTLFKSICAIKIEKRKSLLEIRKSDFINQENDLFDSDQLCKDAEYLFSHFESKSKKYSPFSQPTNRLLTPKYSKFICSQPNNEEMLI